ncbi:MAG: hypothetical protein K2K91_02545 [Ruminococcus sp.]|nr:hypothetical protein [Ruminococcus sp.]
MKMIPDIVGAVGFMLLSERVSVEVSNGQYIGIKSSDWHILLFPGIVGGLYALVSAHIDHLT